MINGGIMVHRGPRSKKKIATNTTTTEYTLIYSVEYTL